MISVKGHLNLSGERRAVIFWRQAKNIRLLLLKSEHREEQTNESGLEVRFRRAPGKEKKRFIVFVVYECICNPPPLRVY